jgi:hypothetical protein
MILKSAVDRYAAPSGSRLDQNLETGGLQEAVAAAIRSALRKNPVILCMPARLSGVAR